MSFQRYTVLRLVLGLAGGVLATGGVPAQAALGEKATSIEADRLVVSGAHLEAARHEGYTVHGIVGSGLRIREYAAPGSSGVVFAVAWDGSYPPDLSELLGKYFDQYQQALQENAEHDLHRGPRTVQAGRLVVEKWGHMRDLHGRAYVRDMLPEGITASAIR